MLWNPHALRCKAKAKSSGQQCQNAAVRGFKVCRVHGANPNSGAGRKKGCDNSKSRMGGGAPGNQNGLKHGAYTPKLQPEEQPMYETLLTGYMEDVPNPSMTDRQALSRLAVLETKWHTAVTQGAPADALDVLHRLLHRELKALQVTRESRDAGNRSGTTATEVVAELMRRAQQHVLSVRPAPALPQEAGSDDVIEFDAVEDGGDADA